MSQLITRPPEDIDRSVRRAVYQHFVLTGEAPTAASVASGLGETITDVTNAMRRLADAHVLVLKPDSNDIWMAMPFSAVPTAFRVRAAKAAWWANCAWDALGIAAALQSDVEIESTCAQDGNPLRLSVTAGTLYGDGLVHFAVPAAHWWDDIDFT